MNYYSISYDIHSAHRHSSKNHSNELREYICCILVELECDRIMRYTGSTIHFSSILDFDDLVGIIHTRLVKHVTVTIEEIALKKNGHLKLHLHKRDKTSENNFIQELTTLQNLTPDKISAKILKHVLYFG